MNYGGQTEVGAIQSIIVKTAADAFETQERIDEQHQALNYVSRPDLAKAIDEYDQFLDLLKETIPNVHYLKQDDRVGIDSIYPRDAMISTDRGVILCNMGKKARRTEPKVAGEFLTELGVPILGEITGDGYIEGGDLIWLDSRTLVVARGYRTNDEGIRQLRELTADLVNELVVVPLPHWNGPSDVLHLMSFISPVGHDVALVYSRIMPVVFREFLLEREIKLIEVPDEEYDSMACNVLAVAPMKCIMLGGNNRTREALEDAGVEVRTYTGNEISRKGCGGPTCLTRPIHRQA